MNAAPLRGKTELTPVWRVDAGDYVVAVDLSPDGRLCAIGTGSGLVLVVDAKSGAEQWRTDAYAGGVLELAFSPDGEVLATCGQHAQARLFSASGQALRALEGGASWVEHLAWEHAGRRLATAAGRNVRVWTADGEPVVETEPLPSTVTALGWARSGGGELAATSYGGVHIWNVANGARARHLAWKGSLIAMAWSPDGNVIACTSQDSSVHFWRLKSGQDSEMRGYPLKPKALAWDAHSSLLATSGDATVTVWDFLGKGPEGRRPLQLHGHKGACTCLAFNPRKGLLASGSQDTGVLLWAPRRSLKPLRYAFLEDEITALAWHPFQDSFVGADSAGNVAFCSVG